MKAKVIYLLLCSVMTSCSNPSPKDITVVGADGTEFKTYQDACRAGDFDAAWSFVDQLDEMVNSNLDKYDRYQNEYVNAYINARDYVFNSEAQLLMSMGTDDASNRLFFLLNSLPMKGKELPEGYEGTDAGMEIVDGSSFAKDFAWYCESVNSFNMKCRQIVELCVAQKNKYLADKILNIVKQTPYSKEKDVSFEYIVYYSDKDKIKIKEIYDEAVKSGYFN